ncbi:MAG: alpha/beta hydrolase [Agathobacter sp.]|nr:alpha/beta hydrolase [Agathobacter sp.]
MRYNIWGENIPYNTGKSKLDDMPGVHKDWTMEQVFTHPDNLFNDKDTIDSMEATDTMVYMEQFLTGNSSENYDDVPYLEAYPVEGSKYCVLDVPGGAYLMVSMVGEGQHVAERLNELGISVFVLRYRTYPYKTPTAFADCQRAIRWLIAHADEFGYDADKVSMIGYSAGGNLVGTTYHNFLNKDIFPADYVKDEIDQIEAKVATIGMVYPKTMFTNGSKLLYAVVGIDVMNDPVTKEKAIEEYTLNTKVAPGHVPTFLVNATNDGLIPSEDILDYAMRLHKAGVPFEMHNYGRGDHGFGGCKEPQHPMFPADRDGLETWMDLYALWLKKNS